jgi:hypothetical protein
MASVVAHFAQLGHDQSVRAHEARQERVRVGLHVPHLVMRGDEG